MNEDLISRTELLATVKKLRADPYNSVTDIVYLDRMLRIIEDTPLVESEPVKHATWVYVDDGIALRCKCSRCGESEHVRTNRCCTCGSWMKEGDAGSRD